MTLPEPRLRGLGCMGLSGPEVDAERAKSTLHAALDAGVRFFDTADVYGPSAEAVGHNERLLAASVVGQSGVIVATKGGLVRRGAQWVPDGRAKHLKAACEASLRRLGVEAIDVYLLHAPDPRVPFATSVRALAALKKAGKIVSVGLSNVSVEQLEAAREIVDVAYLQVELSVRAPSQFESGVAEYARDHGIRLVAHRPLGGAKSIGALRKRPVLQSIATRYGVSAADIALAWLYDLEPRLVALPGATRPQTGAAAGRTLALDPEDRRALDAAFPFGRNLRTPRAERRPRSAREGEVVVLMGMPGSGKTGAAEAFEAQGYLRLNRDERGGLLADLIPLLETALAEGRPRVVLDNTYPDRASRNRVIEAAWRAGVKARCVWVDADFERAQVFVVRRMLDRHGRLLDAAEAKTVAKTAPPVVLPRAMYRFRERFEIPTVAEGFEAVERRPSLARFEPGARSALIIDLDPLMKAGLPKGWAASLQASSRTHLLGGLAWCPGEAADAARARVQRWVREQLRLELHVEVCVHPAGPPSLLVSTPAPGARGSTGRGPRARPRPDGARGPGGGQRGFREAAGLAASRRA